MIQNQQREFHARDKFEAYLPLFSAIHSYFMDKIFILR